MTRSPPSDGKTLQPVENPCNLVNFCTAVSHQARRVVELLRTEAELLVARLFREKKETRLVMRSLNEDGELSELLRRAARHAVLRRNLSAANGTADNRGMQKK